MKPKAEPTVAELNAIQSAWMALAHDAPEPVKRQVFQAMEAYPRVYLSGHDGLANVIIYGMPAYSIPQPLAIAREHCEAIKGRTDVIWNGNTGRWEVLP